MKTRRYSRKILLVVLTVLVLGVRFILFSGMTPQKSTTLRPALLPTFSQKRVLDFDKDQVGILPSIWSLARMDRDRGVSGV